MFGGSEKDSLEIGTGEYNKKLDAKIAEIRTQCNISNYPSVANEVARGRMCGAYTAVTDPLSSQVKTACPEI